MMRRWLFGSRCMDTIAPVDLLRMSWPEFFGLLVGSRGLTVFNDGVRSLLIRWLG